MFAALSLALALECAFWAPSPYPPYSRQDTLDYDIEFQRRVNAILYA
jgi:hypothetical protein